MCFYFLRYSRCVFSICCVFLCVEILWISFLSLAWCVFCVTFSLVCRGNELKERSCVYVELSQENRDYWCVVLLFTVVCDVKFVLPLQ
jgi:hypothetical protein